VDYAHQRLFDGEYVCVMRRDHPLGQSPLTLDTFCAARHLLVSFSGRPYGFVDEALAALGRQRRVVMTVNQFATAGRVVAESNLLTVLPRHFVQVTGMQASLQLRELPLDVPMVHVDMVWSKHRPQTAAQVWLREAVAQAARLAQARHGGSSSPSAIAKDIRSS
jgi:DNA-binding transcriptional LysR family regulator